MPTKEDLDLDIDLTPAEWELDLPPEPDNVTIDDAGFGRRDANLWAFLRDASPDDDEE